MRKFLVALASLLSVGLFATPAFAGPLILIGAVLGAGIGAGAAAAGLIAASLLTAAAIGAAIGIGAAFLLGDGLMGMFDVPELDVVPNTFDQAQNENTGILIDKQGTLVSVPVVYGTRKTGGIRVFVDTTGTNNEFLYVALVLSEGEIDRIDEVFIDGVLSDDPMFSGRIEIEKFLGTSDQVSSTLLQESPNWSSEHKLSGLAYLALRFQWKKIASADDAEKNPFGGIPKVQAIVRGKLIANATTAGGVTYDNETTRYSENPADHLLDYLRNSLYGRGLVNNRIHFTSFNIASTKFDETVTYHQSGGTGPMLTSNAVIDSGKTLMNNVKKMLKNSRSGMPYVQGKFKIKLLDTGNGTDSQNVDVSSDIVFAVTEDHLVDGIKLEGSTTRNHFNQVILSFPDPTSDWQMSEVIFPKQDSDLDVSLLDSDAGRRLSRKVSFNHITSAAIAGDLASIILYRSRNKKTVSFKTTAELHEVEVGDLITITYANLGFSAVKYRVQSMKIESDYTISIGAVEHEPTEYVFRPANQVSLPTKQLNYRYDSDLTNTYKSNFVGSTETYREQVGPTRVDGLIPTNNPSGLSATFLRNNWNSAETGNYDDVTLNWTPPSDYFQYDYIDIAQDHGLHNENRALSIKQTIPVTSDNPSSLVFAFPEFNNNANGAFSYTLGVRYRTATGYTSDYANAVYTTSNRGQNITTSVTVSEGVIV